MHMCSPWGSTILSSNGARSWSSSASICLSTLIVSALPARLSEHGLGDLDGRRRHREVEVGGETPGLPELRGPALGEPHRLRIHALDVDAEVPAPACVREDPLALAGHPLAHRHGLRPALRTSIVPPLLRRLTVDRPAAPIIALGD